MPICPVFLSFLGSRLAPKLCTPLANFEKGDKISLAVVATGLATFVILSLMDFRADSLCDEVMFDAMSCSEFERFLSCNFPSSAYNYNDVKNMRI